MRLAPKTARNKSTPQCAAARIKPHEVLWNGIDPLLQALSNLLARASIGKILILLSDLGKRWALNAICRARLGFNPSSFTTIRWSAKPAYAEIKQRSGKGIAPEATGWCHARDGNLHSLEEPALTPAEEAGTPDILIMTGRRESERSLNQWQDRSAPTVTRNRSVSCANLTEAALTPEGSQYQAGGSALLYKDLAKTGDRVDKPSQLIYRIMCDVLGGPNHTGVLGIGACPAHNIAGGNAAGFIAGLVRWWLNDHRSDAAQLARHQIAATPYFITPNFNLAGPK